MCYVVTLDQDAELKVTGLQRLEMKKETISLKSCS